MTLPIQYPLSKPKTIGEQELEENVEELTRSYLCRQQQPSTLPSEVFVLTPAKNSPMRSYQVMHTYANPKILFLALFSPHIGLNSSASSEDSEMIFFNTIYSGQVCHNHHFIATCSNINFTFYYNLFKLHRLG